MEALRLAYDESRKGGGTALHRDVCDRIDGHLGPSYAFDRNWTNAVDCRSRLRQEKLEINLHGYMTNLMKERILMGFNDLGNFCYALGKISRCHECLYGEFIETGPDLGKSFPEVIAPQDVAIYGGFSALVSFDRAELKELVPEVRELINDSCGSRYASCTKLS
ncbi:hypothetical protein GUJ93_ZPchr0012g19329 [Zizania palustris]|uniref:Uncharacterized protein n=1 Tax=Zizania palustris TaxID=103762 RepID=A0A8J6BQK0_ZIZPA|nr:hypothetical protein GUJ93_ZPchr0012g19329 [Zizania palustris]